VLRSMYSGVSGLRNHQTRLDVIGNNIANVNTIGFKSSRVTFKDLFSQTLQAATSAYGDRGGSNPVQVGLGMTLASIDTNHSDGSIQYTGNGTDLAIEGSGFFIIRDGSTLMYTRAGNFDVDEEGYLVVPGSGLRVQGLDPNVDGRLVDIRISTGETYDPVGSLQSYSIDGSGTIIGEFSNGLIQDLGQVALARFANPGGLMKVGNTAFMESNNSGIRQIGRAGTAGFGSIASSSLEMSNVDLSLEFTEMIVTQRGLQANSRIITTSDEVLQEVVNLKR
jgi:flagellar hook protein FlgE